MFIVLPIVGFVVWIIIGFVLKPSFLVGLVGGLVVFFGGFFLGHHLDMKKVHGKMDRLTQWLKSNAGFSIASASYCAASASKVIACDSGPTKIALAALIGDQIDGCIVGRGQVTGYDLASRQVRLQNDEIKKNGFASFEVQQGQVTTFYDLTIYLTGARWPAFALSFIDDGTARTWVGVVIQMQQGGQAPAETQPAAIAEDKGLATQLAELSARHTSGSLTAEEFAKAKAKLLSS